MHEAAHDAEDEISDVVGQLRVEQNLPQGFVEDAHVAHYARQMDSFKYHLKKQKPIIP